MQQERYPLRIFSFRRIFKTISMSLCLVLQREVERKIDFLRRRIVEEASNTSIKFSFLFCRRSQMRTLSSPGLILTHFHDA